MLTRILIRNFKLFDNVEVELGDRVVFIGPNNSGKTSVLQALALWEIGLKKWTEKRGIGKVPPKRPGVTINRRDLISVPIPVANLLWKDLHLRESQIIRGKQDTKNIRIDILVEGVSSGSQWKCGFEFDYANEESFYCRPLRLGEGDNPERMDVPEEASSERIAYLPPMSGLSANETRLDPGAINVRLGEGRTAEVLRNLCYQVLNSENGLDNWTEIKNQINSLFGINLENPVYLEKRGEVVMSYRTKAGVVLDISSSGRGLQQTLLLLSYLKANPGTVLLLDEPDAHLELLRQRQTYQLLAELAEKEGNQLIAASHSEVYLNEAADRDTVVAFVGKPHRIDNRGSQVLKSLKEIGFDQYYQAETTGWVLYLEGSTDLAILRTFAENLQHPARDHLSKPFVKYVYNQPTKAKSHFFGLKEAKTDLVGIAIYDHLQTECEDDQGLLHLMWTRREIENYLCDEDVLLQWAQTEAKRRSIGPLFTAPWEEVMKESIEEISVALTRLMKQSPWDPSTKVTDDFLDPLFSNFFEKLKLPNLMRKTDYHVLAKFLSKDKIDPEICDKLDAILTTAENAKPGIIECQ